MSWNLEVVSDQLALLKLSAAVRSKLANPQYPDYAIFHASEDFTYVFANATHAEKPKGMPSNLLSNIWWIDSETIKRTTKTTNQLNRQDTNSKLSRKFGTNDWMLGSKWIK